MLSEAGSEFGWHSFYALVGIRGSLVEFSTVINRFFVSVYNFVHSKDILPSG